MVQPRYITKSHTLCLVEFKNASEFREKKKLREMEWKHLHFVSEGMAIFKDRKY